MIRRLCRPAAAVVMPLRLSLLLACLLAPLAAVAEGETAIADYAAAERAFASGAFADAASLLERLLAADPRCAPCAHLLGKSYGRLAERAGWLEAMRLARKTQLALEQAVELAPEDPEPLADLIKYYRAAPAFLGGDNEKAELLEQRLEDLRASRTG